MTRRSPRSSTSACSGHVESPGVLVAGPTRPGTPGQASFYFNDPFGNHLELTCMGYPKAIAVRPPVPERITWDAAQLR